MQVGADGTSESELNRRWIVPAVIVGLLLIAAFFVYRLVNTVGGVARPEPAHPTVNLLPPPPPPPPPPQEQPPPKPEPTNQPTPAPTPAPQTPQAPAPVSIAGPAQAGTDAFGVQSGNGLGGGAPGSIGTCIGANCGQGGGGSISDSFYRRYLGSALEAALRQDKRVNRKTFAVTVLIWVSPGGAVTRADMVKGTGDDKLDQSVAASLKDVASLDAPTAIQFPQRVVVRGTRGI